MTTRSTICAVALALVASNASAVQLPQTTSDTARTIADLQTSYIAANAPPESTFMQLLERDVRAYLIAHRFPSKDVRVDLLRKGATQSGVAYPKYYLWVRASDATGRKAEGVMRVAAVERVRFDVTDFTLAVAIRTNPTTLEAIYPAVLIPAIRERAVSQ